ncbi:MAG: hypothetical protein AB2L12_18150 [Smithellaceae bacterium]
MEIDRDQNDPRNQRKRKGGVMKKQIPLSSTATGSHGNIKTLK